jgi:zinc carboxypeptidase
MPFQKAKILLVLTVCASTRLYAQRDSVQIPPDHYTKAELSTFKDTPTYEETVAFLLRLTKTSPYLHLDWIGSSGQGRRMPLVVVSKEKAFTPEEAWKSGKPVVLVLNSIHGGEVDGTDASLILLRDIALTNRPEVLDAVTLLVVPIYNLDGHERVSKYNRPNQDGPILGMGFRTNARGLDLNRDWLKADAPETRAVLALASAWKPDVFIDDHVSDGSDHQATFTLAYAAEPHTPKPLADWLKKVVPRALREVEEAGYKTSPYVEWIDPRDPLKGIDSGAAPPRYSTCYFPLRGTASILVETHAIKPYAERVRANAAFLQALLPIVGKDAKGLAAARAKARDEARHAAVGSPFVLDGETDRARPETIDFPGYAWTQVLSPVMGTPVLRFDRMKPVLLKMPVFLHAKPTVTVPRPAAYVVPSGWPEIEERLKAHGVKYRKLETAQTLEVGTYRVESASLAKETYQGDTRVTAKIRRGVEKRAVPAGSLYVSLETELAPVVMHLLEPEGPDSLFQWGKLSTVLEQKEWIDPRVLDPLAEKMLAEDPKLKSLWEEKLKDPKFADSASARHRFFYERTPYWDETVGLIPVYRLDKPMAEPPPTPPAAASAGGRG